MSTGAPSSVDPASAGLPLDAAIGECVERPHGGHLIRADQACPWSSVFIEHVRAGQPRPYADSVYEYLVTFAGGSPSTIRGWHLPFATMPPFDPSRYERPGSIVHDRHSKAEDPMAERKKEHDGRIKAKIRAATKPWDTDSTLGEARKMGGTWLETFEVAYAGPAKTTYRVVVKTMFMD